MSSPSSMVGVLSAVLCVLLFAAHTTEAQAYIIGAPTAYTATYGSIGTHSYGYTLGPSYVAYPSYVPRYSLPFLIKK